MTLNFLVTYRKRTRLTLTKHTNPDLKTAPTACLHLTRQF